MNRRQWLKAVALLVPGLPASYYAAQYAANGPAAFRPPSLPLPPTGSDLNAGPQQPVDDLPAYPLPSDAVREALADAVHVAPVDLFFTRWIWFPDNFHENFRAVSDVLNKVSQTANIVRPLLVSPHLLRIDLRWYWPDPRTLAVTLRLWEDLQFDPSFSLLITKATFDRLSMEQRSFFVVSQPWLVDDGAGRWVKKYFHERLSECNDIVVARTNPMHLARSGIEMLQDGTGSQAPVVHHGYMLSRFISTIKDRDKKLEEGKERERESVYSTVWGGLYYDLAGVRRSQVKGRSDLDQLLLDIGIGDGKQPFQRLFDDRLRSDARAAVFRSAVTGKPRRIDWFGTSASNINFSAGVIFITNDLRDKDVDVDQHPLMNLVKFRTAAYEVIWTRANGMQGYALFNDKGELLVEAAPDVVTDSTVPHPFPSRLSIPGCIRCHGPEDGWQPFDNDVRALWLSRDGFDTFGDLTDLNRTLPDTVDRLFGQYRGLPRKPLSRAREDYDGAVLQATDFPLPLGSWPGGNVHVARRSSAAIARTYAHEKYDGVDARIALVEIGFSSPRELAPAVEKLRSVLPPDARAKTAFGITLEDVRLGALKAGRTINRPDWQFIDAFALERANHHRR